MRDFQLKPNAKNDYSLFLVRNISKLNLDSFNSILNELSKKDLLVSFERLFKGEESALVVFGPKNILLNYQDLNLLELEDYTDLNLDNISIWEADVRTIKGLRANLPKLLKEERIWIQIVGKLKLGNSLIPAQVRIVIFSPIKDRLKSLTDEFQKNFKNTLPKIPRPYAKDQLFDFYKQRSFLKEGKGLKLRVENILYFSLFL